MKCVRVGEPAPEFELACVSTQQLDPWLVRLSDFAGRWLLLIFYPRDFTFVCPTELSAFSARWSDFEQRDCQVLGISADSVVLHQEWLILSPHDGGLGPLRFPLASDANGEVARSFGVWVERKQLATRGLFVIDPQGVLQYSVIHNLNVGRSPDEVLRVLDALRTGGMCPASWTAGDGTLDPERALQQGAILGHYRVRKKLGSGTFGTVFAAWDQKLERMVAIKVLNRDTVESRDAILRESRTAAKLNHPHVATVYAVETEEGVPLISMEYIEGPTLSQAIASGLPREEAMRLATQIASGMAAAHELGVVHGDLKPANVMVTPHGFAKILDFGLAQAQDRSHVKPARASHVHVRSLLQSATVLPEQLAETIDYFAAPGQTTSGIQGSLAYMAPEQAQGAGAIPASDVFSFGLTLIEMLTGRPAHAEPSPVKLLVRLQTEEMAEGLTHGLSPGDRELVLPMLTRDPAQRPTMGEVARRMAEMAG
jgi:alkyl hydroperoxide reductase subunit AhpC/tRNA A-37 threonylcarbamoyl transferase component Bud32